MELSVQFQVILVSYFYGFLFMIIIDLFNRLFYFKKGTLIRLIFETLLFICMSLIYFLIMLITCDAIFNIFIILFLLLGVLSYIVLLQKYMLSFYDFIFVKTNKKVLMFKLKLKAKYDKIKMKHRKKKISHEKNKWTKRSNTNKKQT